MTTRVGDTPVTTGTADIKGATSAPNATELKVVATADLPSGHNVVVKFLPATATTPAKVEINGKKFSITHVKFRNNHFEDWKNVKIEDLSQSDLNQLSETCADLFRELAPTKDNLSKLDVTFARANDSQQTSWRNSKLLSKIPLAKRLYQEPEKNRLELKEFSTLKEGASEPVVHSFKLDTYNEASQKVLLDHLAKADASARNIEAKARIPEKPKATKSLESLTKSPETDTSVEKDVAALNTQLDDLLTNTRTPEKVVAFEKAIHAFAAKYKQAEYPEEFKKVHELYDILRQIKQTPGLFLQEPRMDDKGVMKMPADGNCYFHAVSAGLQTLETPLKANGTWNDDIKDQNALRTRVAAYMKAHVNDDALLKGYIDEGIEAYLAVRKIHLENEKASLQVLEREGQDVKEQLANLQKDIESLKTIPANIHDIYIDGMGTPGAFASKAEMYAISKMFHVDIHVERQIHGRNIGEVDPVITTGPGCPSITLLHVNGDHFDLKTPVI
jgi:hypothetical protein